MNQEIARTRDAASERTVTRMPAPPVMPEKKKTAAYARVSLDKDSMMHSLSAQVSYYSTLIQNNPEWEYAGVYADAGLTGTRTERTEFQRMLADCRAGRIDQILVKSISRFARNTVALLETVRELKAMGVAVVFEEQKINTLSGEGELMLAILASFFQEESRSVSENCKWRIRHGFEQGLPTGFRMYGFEVHQGRFAIVAEQAEVIRRIGALYLQGYGKERICKALNRDGIPSPGGGRWYPGVVHEILNNVKIAGDLLLQRYYSSDHIEKKTLRNRGELPQYFVQGDHEGIIPRETFDAIQAELVARASKWRPKQQSAEAAKAAYPLTGLLRCAGCGSKYRRKIARAGTPYAAPVWICNTFNRFGKASCPTSRQIPETILLAAVAEVMGVDAVANEAVEALDHIEVHPENRLRFVFPDGGQREYVWRDHSRKDSWSAEMRRQAGEKTRERHAGRRKAKEAQS